MSLQASHPLHVSDKVSTGQADYKPAPPAFSTDTAVTVSNLPGIGKTAIANMTCTNDVFTGVDDIVDECPPNFFDIGRTALVNFEAASNGGDEPRLLSAFPHVPDVRRYAESVSLDCGESHTYIIEVRAVKEENTWIADTGYCYSGTALFLHLDAEETMLCRDRLEKYLDLYAPPEDPLYVRTPILPSYTDKELGEIPDCETPSRKVLAGFFEAYFAGTGPKESIGSAMTFVHGIGIRLNYTLTDLKEILGDARYADDEIEAGWMARASMQSSHP